MSVNHPVLNAFNLGALKLRNRAVVAPMTRVSTAGDGIVTAAMADYYSRYAAGGFALIITEGTYTDRRYAQAYPNQSGMTTDAQQAGWTSVVDAIRAEGGKVILQLMHAGALSQQLSSTRGPSAVQPIRAMLPGYSHKQGMYPRPQAMNLAEIDAVVDGFVNAAKRAEGAGFDGVEIHAANGYLLDQFLTDYTNTREDKYGGSTTNRIRLSAEITEAVRQHVSDRFVVGIRLSQGKVNDFDYLWPGGMQDGEIIFKAVQDAGADYIHFASEGKGFDHGCLTREGHSLTQQARQLTGLPVVANGGLDDPNEARRILDEGHGDLVALGTGALANADWPKKIASNTRVEKFDPAMFTQGVDILSQFEWERKRDHESSVAEDPMGSASAMRKQA